MNIRTHVMSAAAVMLVCGMAFGQGGASKDGSTAPKAAASGGMSGSFSEPLGAGAGGDTHYLSSYTDGDDTYELRIDNGERTVTHNGDAVPESKLRTRRNKLQVLGDDGQVVCEFDLPGRNSGTRGRQWGGVDVAPLAPRGQIWKPLTPQAPAMVPAAEPPKVMLGLYMSPDEDGKVEVSKVISGLAAEKAGVQEGDVLVSLDGKSIDDISSIRAILKDHKPGDSVDLVVHRDGKDTTLKVNLQAYEQQKLGMGSSDENEVWQKLNQDDWSAKATDAIAKAIDQVKRSEELKDAREEITKSLQSALEAVKSAKQEGMSAIQQIGPMLSQRMENLRELQGSGGGGRSFIFSAPAAPEMNADNMKALQDKLDALQQKLDRMNEKLDALAKKN
ncbi:MAG: PDZ domain-containing protein [Tepidisphaera sp.]|nr:PDZ domain-containing protein [Tepidisphaera sp.]